VVLDTRTAIRESKSFESFKGYVSQKREEILTSDWNKQEKVNSLSYLVLLEQSLGFMKANQDLVPIAATKSSSPLHEPQKEEGWWSSWGKCVAGTTGGAIMGGLTGAGVGSTVPAIGTGTGAAVGAVGGGLSGAAASC